MECSLWIGHDRLMVAATHTTLRWCKYLLRIHSMTNNQAIWDILGEMTDPTAHKVKHSTICRYVVPIHLCHFLTKHVIYMVHYAWLLCIYMNTLVQSLKQR